MRWLVVVVTATTACGGGHDPDPPVPVTATDGDPTGGDASELGCLIEPEDGRAEFRYQCEGAIVIDVVVEGSFDGSPTVIGSGWLAAAGAVSCAPDPLPREIPPVVWAGEHLESAPQEGAYELCAGTLPYMDRYVELVAEAMGVEIEQPLVFRWRCGLSATGR